MSIQKLRELVERDQVPTVSEAEAALAEHDKLKRRLTELLTSIHQHAYQTYHLAEDGLEKLSQDAAALQEGPKCPMCDGSGWTNHVEYGRVACAECNDAALQEGKESE